MASKPIAWRSIPCLLETYYEDQCCPHAVQVVLAGDTNGTWAVRVVPIMVGNNDNGKKLLAHLYGIVLQQRMEKEELALWHEVLLDERDGVHISS